VNPKTMNRILLAVKRARVKHPDFAPSEEYAVSIAAEEFGEWAKEVNEDNRAKAEEEALDLIAVLVRYLEELSYERQI